MEAIDLPKLRRVMADTVVDIRRLKHALRAPWTRPMAEEQRELCLLKAKATLLYILRAHVRGRCHLTRVPDPKVDRVAYHHDMARRAADRYQLFTEIGAAS
jgi:hypothetical protein